MKARLERELTVEEVRESFCIRGDSHESLVSYWPCFKSCEFVLRWDGSSWTLQFQREDQKELIWCPIKGTKDDIDWQQVTDHLNYALGAHDDVWEKELKVHVIYSVYRNAPYKYNMFTVKALSIESALRAARKILVVMKSNKIGIKKMLVALHVMNTGEVIPVSEVLQGEEWVKCEGFETADTREIDED